MIKYDTYKESGIDWIGEIPSHWEVGKVSHLFSFSRGLPITKQDLRDEGIPCVNYGEVHSKYGFRVNPEEHLLKCVEIHYLETNEKSILTKGDFVFADTSEDIEGSGNFTFLDSEVPTFAGYHTIIARIKGDNEYKYLGYFFDSPFFRNQIRSNVSGVKVFSITQAILKNSSVLLPEIQEQTVIALYLDRKTAEIDELIADKKRLLELYEEEKTAIINQAVTKGINPNVPMKDSGIEWLGEIPEHWDVSPLKYLGKFINGYSFKSTDFESTGVRVLKISNIQHMRIDWTDESFIDDIFYETHENFRVLENDLVFALTRPIISSGIKVALIDNTEHILLNQRNSIYRPTDINVKWVYYILLSANFIQEFDSRIDKTGQQPNISSNDIGEIKITIPNEDEQKEIISFIDEKCGDIENKKTKTEKLIELLTEYRTALVSEVVTGKVKVIE